MEPGRHEAGPLSKFVALLPAALLLVFALWCGTFAGGASARGALVAHGILWLGGLWVGSSLAGWNRRHALSLGLAWGAVAWPWALSPVHRAGSSAVALLPAMLILPWLVARCWRGPEAQRLGPPAVSVVVSIVAGRALWGWWRLGTDGASLPLGHHNLLAAFLVMTLPVAVIGLGFAGIARWLAVSSAGLGLAALLATRSLAGGVALAAVVLYWLGSARVLRHRWRLRGVALWAGAGVLAVLAFALGVRLWAVVSGTDPSSLARVGYWRAGWNGFVERPWLGWGPGSTPWTVHEFFRPVPGVHPPDEVLADLHGLPLQLLYELGLMGCGLLVVAAWLALRHRGHAPYDASATGAALPRAGRAGLVGFAVVSLGGMPLSVGALTVALAVAAGAALSASGRSERSDSARAGALSVTLAAVLASMWVVLPRDMAQLAWERAGRATAADDRLRDLRRAVALDPGFPLYRWRLALALNDATMAQKAAEDARSVAALWLAAGDWDRACRLSPFGAVAPFRAGSVRGSVTAKARALAAQPWLLAAVDWREQPGEVAEAVARLAADPRIEVGWRGELYRRWQEGPPTGAQTASIRRLVLEVDAEPATSLSLHAFRRLPWPVRVAEIPLDASRLAPLIGLPPASQLPATEPSVFRSASCALGEPGS